CATHFIPLWTGARLTNGARSRCRHHALVVETLPGIVNIHKCSYKAASKRRNAVALCPILLLIGN
ncbi:MAG TPA: hypothetical protein VFB56_10330, partial [Nitrospiraceae bacterium]|nr:hypothetical protein [Nitrospiraceae bacterium]